MEDLSSKECLQELNDEEDFRELNRLIDEGDDNIDTVISFIDTNHITHERYKQSKFLRNIPTCVYPIITAAKKGHVKILNSLILRDFDPSYRNIDCYVTRMPIHYACRNGHVAVVKSLVTDHGVDANAVDSEGENAMSMAIYAGSVDIVACLVESGASVTGEISLLSSTPLHLAVQQSQSEIVNYLISAGADVNQINYLGYPPLSFVPYISTVKVAQLLLEAGAETEAMATNETPFVTATKRNMLDLMKLLHQHGADPEAVNKDGLTPLRIAVSKGNYETVRYLVLDLQVNLSYITGDFSPLQIALEADNMKMVYLLLEAGHHVGVDFFVYNENYLDTDGILAYIRNHALSPRSLQKLCSVRIRQLLGKRLMNRADYLPLPSGLIAFVKFNYIP